uniref:Putative da-p36 protein n=1 Tax=Rhipicephalus pulchellus TaxID=72859 RepID=L7LRS1_RHIPC
MFRGSEPPRKDMTMIILKALATLMFLIIPTEGRTVHRATAVTISPEIISGMTRMVNLTSKAEKFTKTFVRGRGTLKTLNFEGGVRPLREPPVKATVNQLIYGPGCKYTEEFEKRKCKDVLTWDIDSAIVSPLNLPVNTTVRLIGKNRTVTVALDFNGASNLTWSSRNGNPSKRKRLSALMEPKCHFSAEASFNGYIAFHLEEVRGDMPKDDAFNIVALRNPTERLEVRDNMLVYNVTGTFQHTLLCKGDTTKPNGKIPRSV